LLAAGIVNLDGKGGYAGWRYIFFLEVRSCSRSHSLNITEVLIGCPQGGFTVLFGIVLFFLLPRSPAHSRFLTAEQRAHIDRRLKLDTPAGASNDFDTQFSWREVRMALTSPQVLLILVALFGNGLTLCASPFIDLRRVQWSCCFLMHEPCR